MGSSVSRVETNKILDIELSNLNNILFLEKSKIWFYKRIYLDSITGAMSCVLYISIHVSGKWTQGVPSFVSVEPRVPM